MTTTKSILILGFAAFMQHESAKLEDMMRIDSRKESLMLNGYKNDIVDIACKDKKTDKCLDTLARLDNEAIAKKLRSYDSLNTLRANVAESLRVSKIADSLKIPQESRKFIYAFAKAVKK